MQTLSAKSNILSWSHYLVLLQVFSKEARDWYEKEAITGNTKSSKTVMNNPDHYCKTKLIKIGDYNISENGDIVTIPHYLAFVLGKI